MTPIEPRRAAPNLLVGFAASVSRYPDRIAVKAGDRMLTYRQLDEASDALSFGVKTNATVPARRVAVFCERSIDVVVAALATLKAGSCYVPLDPALPAARLRLILDEATPALVVTSRALRDRLPAGVPVLCVDEPGTAEMAGPVPETAPSVCAYIIFTSGTTGRPKGVQISHANVLSLFAATDPLFDFGPGDVWSMFHSFAFDFSVWEMWGALLHGGCVVIVPDGAARDPAAFRTLLRDERVTVLSQTPTAFKALMDEERKHPEPLPLRWVVFGGEALRFPDLGPWIAKYGDGLPKVVNMYGITETTVHVSYRRVTRADLDEPASLIGTPLPGSGIILVGPDLTPVPDGQAGEIVVVGPGVGMGYLNQPEQTALRFIDVTGDAGQPVRGYRSGDLARRRASGDLEYLGRADGQVKVRGFRIELGDIEAALTAHPEVSAGAVAIRRTRADEDVIVGYAVPAGDTAPDEHDLREHLSRLLPGYMVPVAFVTLAALPTNVNGKLDRAALPQLRDTAAGSRTGGAALTLREELLCQLFAQVLGRPAVAPDDDFFAIGAHSLSAIQLVNRIRAVLGATLTIQDVLEARTVAALAVRSGPAVSRPPLHARPRTGEIPLSCAQLQLWRAAHDRRPENLTVTLRLTDPVDAPALESAVRDVVTRHEILRTVYPQRDGTPAQRVLAADRVPPPFTVVRTSPDKLDQVAESASRQDFDVTAEPPLRVALLLSDTGEGRLVIALHPIAADEWSFRPLLADLAESYTAWRRGGPPQWQPLPIQYADFARWQRELSGEPIGRAVSGAPADAAAPVRVDFDADLHGQLVEVARTSGLTVHLVLQAVVVALLSRREAGTGLTIGATVPGRADRSLPALVGRFATTLAIRIDADREQSFAALLRQVVAANVAAHDRQDLPAGPLMPTPDPQWTSGEGFLLPVLLTHSGCPPEFEVPGLGTAAAGVIGDVVASDLSFRFTERHRAGGEPHGIAAAIGYRTGLYERDTVRRMGTELVALARAVLAAPGTPLRRIDPAASPGPSPSPSPSPSRSRSDGARKPVPAGPPAGDGHAGRARQPEGVRRVVADALGVPLGQIDGEFFQLLAGGNGRDAVRSALPLRAGGRREPVFCIHPSSGLSWSYVGLLGHIRQDFPVYGIQSTGLSHPDDLPATVELMAARHLDTIRRIQPDPPYHLIGWSLGGLLAYEMAVQLQRQEAAVGLLALLDCYPRINNHLPPRSGESTQDGTGRLTDALDAVQRGHTAPGSLLEARLVALLKTAYHNRRLAARYEPGFFDGDVLFFQATADGDRGGLTAGLWARCISGEVTAYAVPATHMAMLDAAAVDHIGPVLSAALATL